MSHKLDYEDAKTIAGTALTGSFQNLGSATTHPAIEIEIVNGSDEEIVVSLDGGSKSLGVFPAGAIRKIGTTFREPTGTGYKLESGLQIQVKHNGSVPTEGTISATVLHKWEA